MSIDEMTTEELKLAVHERVMGLEGIRYPDGQWYMPKGFVLRQIPDYPTDIRAAWMIVEKIAETEFLYPQLIYGHSWCFKIWRNNPMVKGDYGWIAEEYAETAPLAICRAALRAMEEK